MQVSGGLMERFVCPMFTELRVFHDATSHLVGDHEW
jgi:hypothetical protein